MQPHPEQLRRLADVLTQFQSANDLTTRELECAFYVVTSEESYRGIGDLMGIKEGTVSNHMRTIGLKLQLPQSHVRRVLRREYHRAEGAEAAIA